MTRQLLRLGANVNQPNGGGATPLYIAAQHNHFEVVTALVEHEGTNVNQGRTDNGATPLHIAAKKNHLEVVTALVEHKGTNVNQARTDNGTTPLNIAAQRNHFEVVKALLEHKANVNKARTDNGITPLLIAAERGHVPVVKALLEHKATNVNQARPDTGITPLNIAAAREHVEVVKALVEHKAINVNQARTDNGITPLHIAAIRDNLKVVEVLLRHDKTDATQLDNSGRTPLQRSSADSHYLMYVLKEAERNPSTMYRALLLGDKDSVTELVRHQLAATRFVQKPGGQVEEKRGLVGLSAEEASRCTPSQRALLELVVQSLEREATRVGLNALTATSGGLDALTTQGEPLLPATLFGSIMDYANTTWDQIHREAAAPADVPARR